MALAQVLTAFKTSLTQCDSLIANAHKVDGGGIALLPAIDQQQITCAAFLNMFIAWEEFLEKSIAHLMVGLPTINGRFPVKYVSPPNVGVAYALIVGVMRYFDFGNQENMRKLVTLYFENGYPYEPHLSGVFSDLADLRTMRNYSAHITANTQISLESLAIRILGKPMPGINLYQMLMMNDPRSAAGDTVFVSYKNKLIVTADLIAAG